MEGSHSVSSAHQDDSWTCQRCGWVYPNAHPSAKHRRNHKKQCGKIKGFELRSELHKGGSSDEASSGDDSHTKKDNMLPQSTNIEAGSAVPAVEHPNAPQSWDLLVTEVNVPDKAKSDTPILQGVSASLDAKPQVTDHESTRDISDIDAIKTESSAPEPEPNVVSLDKTSKTFEEGKVPAHILPGIYTDEAKELVKDIKCEDPPTVEEHSKSHTLQADKVDAVVRDLPGLDSDQSNSAENKDANSEGKYTESIGSLEEPSKTLQDESKVTLTRRVDEVEIALHESQGLDPDYATVKDSLLISKKQGLNQQGSSQVDDSWTCRHCGWVYPNPHPSAKHRKKHKKQCGKLKGFELRTQPSTGGGSSDEVSSDEDIHAKKEHVPHQSRQILQSQEQASETVATESLPQIVDHPAILVDGDIITESKSNSLQPKEFSALKVDAPDGELRNLPNVKDITTPDMAPSVVPELPQNLPSSDQQNLPAGDNKRDAAVLDQAMKVSFVSDEPDTSSRKESPKHSSMNDETLPDQALVQEILGSSETQLNAIPSLSKSVDTLTSEGCGDLGKDAHIEQELTAKLAEEPAGLSGECAPNVASIPSVSDLKSSDAKSSDPSSTVYFEDKGASILKVDEPSAVVMSDMDPRGVGLSNETSDASAGAGLNQSVILKEEIDVSEKPGLSGLDTEPSLDALDDTRVGDPLRKEMGDTLSGGSNGQLEPENSDLSSWTLDDTLTRGSDVQLEPENSDLSSLTLPTDEVPVENKSVTENPLPLRKEMDDTLTGGSDAPENSDLSSGTLPADEVPVVENKSLTENLLALTALSTANVTGLANDAEEEGRFLSAQTSVESVQLIPKNESLVQIVDGGNDDTFSSTTDKTDETPPVSNMAHPLGNQMTSVGMAEVDVPKEVTIPSVTTGEAIASTTDKTDETPPVTNMAPPLGNHSTSVGVAEVDVPKEVTIPAVTTGEAISSTTDKADETPPVTNMAHPLGNQTTSVGVAEEVTIPAVTTAEAISIQKSLDGFTPKDVSSVSEDSSQGATGGDTQNTNTTSFIAKDTGVSDITEESEAGGIPSVKDGEQDKTEASGALQAVAKPEAEEETPFESRGIGSSDLSYNETYSFTRSESGVTAHSELGASHKLSDSLEIYEDAQDSLETCSVGGSVEENDCLDEPHQASDRLQEEPKHSGAASLDERVSGESGVLEQKSTVSNGSRFGEASHEEKAPTFGEACYEEKAPILPGTSYEEKAPTLPGTSYGGRKKMEELKAPSPEAWQEPGPSNVKREGKKISTSEVTEDSKSGESHTALRSLMAKEGPDKADLPIVETSTAAGDLKSSSKKDGSLASASGTKNKSRSFWRHCICCSTVH